jgi:ribosomal protein L31E
MKARNIKYSYSFGVLFFLLVSIVAYGQNTVTQTMKVQPNELIYFDIYDVNTEVVPSKDNAVLVEIEFNLESKDETAVKAVKDALNQHLLTKKDGKVVITNRIYKSIIQNVVTKMTLLDGTKIKIKAFDFTNLKIMVPSVNPLEINGRYCHMNINYSLPGNLVLNGYDLDISGKSVRGDGLVKAKFSNIDFETFGGNLDLNLYEADFKANQCKFLKLDSKFSEVELQQIDSVNFIDYEGELNFVKAEQIIGESKFSEIKNNDAGYVRLHDYEGEFDFGTITTFILKGRFTECSALQVGTFTLKEGYEVDLKISEVKTMKSVSGQFNEFDISTLQTAGFFDGYEEKIKVAKLEAKFTGFQFKGKYGDVSLHIDKKAAYTLAVDTEYGSVDLNKADYSLDFYDVDEDKKVVKAIRKGGNAKTSVTLEGYELNVDIGHL